MSFLNFWTRPAHPTQQGSFCDRHSEVHYDNVDRTTAIEHEVTAVSRGDTVVEGAYETADYADSVRFNTNLTETDSHSMDTPAKLGPGK